MSTLQFILFYLLLCVHNSEEKRKPVPSDCTADELFCPHSFCSPKWERCDGLNHCGDWTDELDCTPTKCGDDEFQCRDFLHMCISKSKICDGVPDCPEWSDEENCPVTNCTHEEFKCRNGRCVSLQKRCNALHDCGGGSDEIGCPLWSCAWHDDACWNGRCTNMRYKCDGHNDCGDWSDEVGCDQHCENGWKSYRGRCFKAEVLEEKITWFEAGLRCQEDDGNLPSMAASDDEKFLLRILPNDSVTTYIGLKKDYAHTYGNDIFRWENGQPLIHQHWMVREPNGGDFEQCTIMNGAFGWQDVFCAQRLTNYIICMKESRIRFTTALYVYKTTLPLRDSVPSSDLLETCQTGELTSKFKICDGQSDCRDGSDESKCDNSCDDAKYRCKNGICISLSFYCDGIDDCGDKSDEETCIVKPCSYNEWTCDNVKCIEESKRCDFRRDCIDKTDEMNCDICRGFECYDGRCISSSWVGDGDVDCNGYHGEDETDPSTEGAIHKRRQNFSCTYEPDRFGKVQFKFMDTDTECDLYECTDMYYKCPHSYCIPVMHVCNGYRDCPDGEDGRYCNAFTCRGYYRCQGALNCIHPSQVCDGVLDCAQGDDERYCPQPCPSSCSCYGRVITCGKNFTSSTTIPNDVRKLDLSGLDVQGDPPDWTELYYLAVLILSDCQITDVDGFFQHHLILIDLDLSNNQIQNLSRASFRSLTTLRNLDLSNNVLLDVIEGGTFSELKALEHLNLRNTTLGVLTDTLFLGLSNLLTLNLANTNITQIENVPFSSMAFLHELDIRQNSIERFSCCFLNSLTNLLTLYTPTYKFCCDSMRPINLKVTKCITSTGGDAISSCKDLLGTVILRAVLWLTALIALFGNIIVLTYRFKYDRASHNRSFGVFVTNLSISNCLMGLYMFIIGSADGAFRGTYEFHFITVYSLLLERQFHLL